MRNKKLTENDLSSAFKGLNVADLDFSNAAINERRRTGILPYSLISTIALVLLLVAFGRRFNKAEDFSMPKEYASEYASIISGKSEFSYANYYLPDLGE